MACGISIEFGVEFSCVDTGWIEGDGESEFSRVNSPESLLSAKGKGRTGGVELGGVRAFWKRNVVSKKVTSLLVSILWLARS